MSWKPQVYVDGQWSSNQLVFATHEEAARYAHDLFLRWTLTTDHRAIESDETPNYRFENGQLHALEENK
jgi:hypothetical protein